MDAETIRAVAKIARSRAVRGGGSAAQGDGMSRLGASRALHQLATDLEVTAAEFERTTRKRARAPRA